MSDVKFNCPFKNKSYSGAKKSAGRDPRGGCNKTNLDEGASHRVKLVSIEETGNATLIAATVPGLPESLHLFAVLWCCGKYRPEILILAIPCHHVCMSHKPIPSFEFFCQEE